MTGSKLTIETIEKDVRYVQDMFKVNNKDIRMTLNSFWCPYC